MIGQTVSHYKITEKIGAGGMGVVYKAEDTKLKRTVALKFLPKQISLDDNEKKRFIHEAQAAAALSHNNIVTIHEINEFEGQTYIAMEYIEGETLKDKTSKHPLPIEEAIRIATQIAEGLNKAHKKDIIHRDIKAANIMVTGDGVAKILDFGLAKLRGQTRLTKTGATLGTVAYMSPEQALGDQVDHRTDIWSLGVLLYEMLAGQLPFRGEYEQVVLYSIMNDELEAITEVRKEVPQALGQVVSKALEKNPDKRYQNLDEFLDDLKSLSEGIVPEEIKARMRKAKLRKRRKTIYWVSAIMIIIAVILLGIFTRSSEKIDSIAVLPLKNLTGDENQEFFVDGVTDELIGQLGQVSGLKRVISRTSVMQYKKTDKSLSVIARELNVDAVVEGTVYQAGDKVRIRFQLIDALPEEKNLWGHTYEKGKAEILMLYSEVTRTIVDKIKINLTPEEQKHFAGARKVNPRAYDAYLKGMFHWTKLTPEDMEKAKDYFELARKEDPNFALAYAGITHVWDVYALFGVIPVREALPKARAALEKALELDDTSAEVQYALAAYKTWLEWDFKAAEAAFKKSIEINPNFPDIRIYYAHFLISMHRNEEAIIQMNRALELDPFNPNFQSLAGVVLMYLRRYDEAMKQFQEALKTVPNHGVGQDMMARVLYHKKRYKESVEFKKAYFSAWGFDVGAEALTRGYQEGGFAGAMKNAAHVWEEVAKSNYILPYIIAELYAYAAESTRTLDWLEKGFEVGDPSLPYIGSDPLFIDLLKDEPRYQKLLRKMKLPMVNQ